MRWCVVLLTVLGLGLLACGGVAAEKPASPGQDSLAVLVDLLAEKGVITADERDALKERITEAEAQKQAEAEAAREAAKKPKYPTMKTKVRLETRFSSVQEDTGQPFFGNRDDRTGGDGFAVRRARLYFMGDVRRGLGYKLQYQSDWGQKNPNLHVAQLEYRGWDFANLVIGQQQTTFGYEIATSDAYLLCIDRAAVSDFLPPDKDIGLMLKSKRPLPGGLGYEIYVGNGSGKYLGNPNNGYLWIARLKAKPTPHLAVAAAVFSNQDTDFSPYQSRFLKKNGDPYGLLSAYTAGAVDERAWEVDAQWTNGRSTVWAEYIKSRIEPDGGAPINADGYYVYLHHFLPYAGRTDKLEAVLGYQKFDPNDAVTDKYDLTAYVLRLNYHLTGHRYHKPRCKEVLRFNYVWNKEAVGSVKNDKFIVQYQTWF